MCYSTKAILHTLLCRGGTLIHISLFVILTRLLPSVGRRIFSDEVRGLMS